MNPDAINNAMIGLIIFVCLLFVLMLVLGTTGDVPSDDNETSNIERKNDDIGNLFYTIIGILGIGTGITLLIAFYYTYVK